MRSCSRQMPVEALAKRSFGTDDGRKERKQRKKNRRRNADRRNAVFCRTLRIRPRPGSPRRTTIGVPPRFSSQGVFHLQGTQHQARLPATWRGHVLRIPLSGRYPPLPVPVQRRTSHSGPSAGGLMPNAARERVASPPAGSALARASGACLPGRVLTGRDSGVYVSISVTSVNTLVTHFSASWPGVSWLSTPYFLAQRRGCPAIGERSDAVLRTAMAGHDALNSFIAGQCI